jgi:4-amino-4-deoxy-L-arabinose transferase-like glycosyltransferase
LFAGFAGAIKYTGLFAPIFSIAFVLWVGRANRARLKSRVAYVVIPATLLIAPWLIKNTIEVHNPVAPFANRLFRNPYTHISFEDQYREDMMHTMA